MNAVGETLVVGTRGEVVAISPEGDERWRVSTGAMTPGPSALLSDGTLVFADAAGEAVAVRDGVVRWRVRFGRGDAVHPAPVPLDDGGVVVATTRDLAALDADGRERARVTLPEPAEAPLVAALGKIVAVATTGVVWAWTPGAPEATRLGSFGGPVDEAAGQIDDHTLVAIASVNTHQTAVDLVRGTTTPRAALPVGLWRGPPALRGDAATMILLGPTTELAVTVDAAGAETMRVPVATRRIVLGADGGLPVLTAVPHTAPIVDAAGTLAFATTDGAVGVLAAGVLDVVPDACPPAFSSTTRAVPAAPVAGLVPSGPGAFVAACRSGVLLSLVAAGGGPGATSAQAGGGPGPRL